MKDIDMAILNATMIGPMSELNDRVKHAVRDFLTQKFAAAYLNAKTPEELKSLQDLWSQITGDVK